MKNKQIILNLIIVGMTLGTTWAIRGQFGHEQGAAWAGAIGAIAIILIAKREDWYSKLFKATLAAAIGWGLGGMMSYGRIVGYGRGDDFVNVYYGLLMLFVIGGLYGFIGGGLFGLTLSDNKNNQVKWSMLLTGMTASGIIAYFFLIMQWEWFMTPPRDESWAACLGAAFFMLWFITQYKNNSALRVAVFAGLGGGFGFAFGNFLQVLGNVMEIPFNFWNVMEYSLGFFGGLGMAYGTFTSQWENTEPTQKRSSNFVPLLLVVLFIPFIVWDQSFVMKDLIQNYSKIVSGDVESIALVIQVIAFFLLLLHAGYVLLRYHYLQKSDLIQYTHNDVRVFFTSHFGLYIIYTLLITGAVVSTYRIEQYLYIVNYVIILAVLPRMTPSFEPKEINTAKWGLNFLIVIVFIAVLAIIAINTHGELPGAHQRFEF